MRIVDRQFLNGPNIYLPSKAMLGVLDTEHSELPVPYALASVVREIAPAWSPSPDWVRRLTAFEESEAPKRLCEAVVWLAMLVQRQMGIPARRGVVRRTDLKTRFLVALEMETAKTVSGALSLAVALVSESAEGRESYGAERLYALKQDTKSDALDFDALSLARAAGSRNIPWLPIDRRIIQLGQGSKQFLVLGSVTSNTPLIGGRVVQDKRLTARILREQGFPVPRQQLVADAPAAVDAAERIGFPVVVKPLQGSEGRGVSADLRNGPEVARAFRLASAYGRVVVETFVQGSDFRLLVVDGELLAAARRVPAQVVGDGRHTVAELVELANRDPARDGVVLYKLTIGDAGRRMLGRLGMTPNSVPGTGVEVRLRSQANFSTGGTPEDVTDQVHADVRRLAVRAAALFGLDVCGIDYVTPDVSQPPADVGGAIIEVNARPGLRLHLVPQRGKARDVLTPILDSMFPPGDDGRIPVVAMAGCRDRGATARILGHLIEVSGKATGIAGSNGAWLSGKRVNESPTDRFRGGRILLRDRQVEAAVIEVSDQDVGRTGLPFDRCDVAVATMVGDEEDPVARGAGGAPSLEAFRVSASVASGALVANADSALCLDLVTRIGRDRLVLVSTRSEHRRVESHVAEGGSAVVMDRAGELVIYEERVEIFRYPFERIPAPDDPAARDLLARSVLSGVAAGYALGLGLHTLEQGLRSLTAQAIEIPLAFRWLAKDDRRILLADDSEPATMKALAATVAGLKNEGRLLLVAAASRATGLGFSRDLSILWDDALEEGSSSSGIEPTEIGAVSRAIAEARIGDWIVIAARAMDSCLAAVIKPRSSAEPPARGAPDGLLPFSDRSGSIATPPKIAAQSLKAVAPVPRAPLWTADELRGATGGRWLGAPPPGWGASGINYYKSQIRAGDVAIATEPKRWGKKLANTQRDFGDFSSAGAACAIVSRRPAEPLPEMPVLLVEDTRRALDEIGRAARARLGSTRIVAITGSAGKTTTKEFTRHLLSRQGPTFGSRRNYNHGPGVPLMLAETPIDARYGVYEFAVDTPDVTLEKARILRPHVALITGIYPDHLMFYGTLEALNDQKCLLFDALEPGGIAILNRDSDFFRRQLGNARSKGVERVLSFGRAEGSDFRVIEAVLRPDGSHVVASMLGERAEFDVPQPGEYMILNCVAALAAVHAAGGSWKRALADIATLPRLGQRNERYSLSLDAGEAELIDDTFSSNPASVRAGLSVLKLMETRNGGRKIAVMGEIRELGDRSRQLHADLAPAVRDAGVDFLFTIGADIEPLREALGSSVGGRHCDDPGEVGQAVAEIMRAGDIVWVKGSRRTPADLERIIAIITGAAKKAGKSAPTGTDLEVDRRAPPIAQHRAGRDTPLPGTQYPGPSRALAIEAGESRARIEILLLGDTSFGENYQVKRERSGKENILKARGYDAPLRTVRGLLAGADLTIANLETPVTDIEVSPLEGKKNWIHWTDVEKAPAHLLGNNIRVVSLANNHTFDFGPAGFDQTLEILERKKIVAFGAGRDLKAAGRPLVVEGRVGDETFVLAMIAALEMPAEGAARRNVYAGDRRGGLNPLEPALIGRQIEAVKQIYPNAFVVVLPHWGLNYKWRTRRQTALARALVSAGADLVVGHGAHMLQEIERIEGRWVIYSLGNFVFNSPGRYAQMGALPYSLVGRLVFERNARGSLERKIQLLPIVTDNRMTNYRTRFVSASELGQVTKALEDRFAEPGSFGDVVLSGCDSTGRPYLEVAL